MQSSTEAFQALQTDTLLPLPTAQLCGFDLPNYTKGVGDQSPEAY